MHILWKKEKQSAIFLQLSTSTPLLPSYFISVFTVPLKMARFRVDGALFSVVYVTIFILLASLPAYCEDEEGHLLQGINSFRQSKSVPALSKHDKADCLADKIAGEIEDQPCPRVGGPITIAASQTKATNYPDLLKKCNIDINTTGDGVIIPVCVKDRVSTLVLTNYTQAPNARYINDSRYTGVGVGKEDDWTVLVLTTNTPGGSFASGACSIDMVVVLFYTTFAMFLLVLLG